MDDSKVEKRQLQYEGIDFWNRPVFVDTKGNRFGNVDILFDSGTSFEKVTERITENDIYYFGTEVDGDPMGSPKIDPNKIVLVKKFEELIMDEAYEITPQQALEDAGMTERDLIFESVVPACCSHTCMVEPDGRCEHGFWSAARELGLA